MTQLGSEAPAFCVTAQPEPIYQPKYKLSLLLFALTFFSTLFVGAQLAISYKTNAPIENEVELLRYLSGNPAALTMGFPFAFTVLGFLMAHEMGHYFACRYYGIRSTLPYFIPFPNLIGTLGAFIKIRSPFQNRKALFDVGIAGPIAGFIVAVPALMISLPHSKVVAVNPESMQLVLGEPLIFQLIAKSFHVTPPPGMDIILHPVAFAAWVGFFATALNLLPSGQLDGGHIVYSLFGGHHRIVSKAFVFVMIPVGMIFWTWWILWAVIPLVLGLNHPPTMDNSLPLGLGRKIISVIGLVIFVLSFSLTPIKIIH